MAKEESVYERLYNIIYSLSSEQNGEYFSLEIDQEHARTSRLLSELYTGKVVNKDTGEKMHIIIKVVPVQKIMSSYSEFYKNEIYFYSKIMPKLLKFQKDKFTKNPFNNTPRYIGGHLTANEEFLILQDPKEAGYRLFDRNRYLETKCLKKVFQIYAKFHALSFVYKHEMPEEFEKINCQLMDLVKLFHTSSRDIAFPIEASYWAAIAAFNVDLEADIVRKLKRVKNVRETLSKARYYGGNYACLTHGSSMLNNMLFKFTESEEIEDVKLIDFQLIFVSTPIHDLSCFFYSCASKADMDNLDYYLEYYYHHFSLFVRELGGNPNVIYPLKVLKEEWKQYSLMGVILGIGLWVKRFLDKNEVDEIMAKNNLPKETYRQLLCDKLTEVHKYSSFKQRARELCLHAVDFGIL